LRHWASLTPSRLLDSSSTDRSGYDGARRMTTVATHDTHTRHTTHTRNIRWSASVGGMGSVPYRQGTSRPFRRWR
jgi:hypothetical protein